MWAVYLLLRNDSEEEPAIREIFGSDKWCVANPI
jgi:hypothetical protein